jgi:hypothetical protein
VTDVFQYLPRFSWRGHEYPVLERNVAFQHENVQHKLAYRNGDLIEQTGARNNTFRYTLALREDIAKGPYRALFTQGLTQLLNDCKNRTPGPLVDPVHGEFTCVPALYDETTDNNKRDGADVRVEFVHSPELDEVDQRLEPTITGIVGDAGALNSEIALVSWNQVPSPEPSTDILSAITGVAAQITAQADRFSASLDDLAFRMEKLDKAVDQLENPQVWPLKRSARRVQDAAIQAQKRISDPGKTIVRVTQNYASTVTAVAAGVGMTVVELLKLNGQLARSPLVPTGTVLYIVKKAA